MDFETENELPVRHNLYASLLFLLDVDGVTLQARTILLKAKFFTTRFAAQVIVVVARLFANEVDDFQFLF